MLHLKDEEEDSPAQPAVHWSERILKQSGWVLQDHLLASFGDGNITAEEFVSQCARYDPAITSCAFAFLSVSFRGIPHLFV